MKLLVIGLNYAPEQVGIGPYTASLCETLAGFGYEVEVVAGEPYYPEWRRRQGGANARRVEGGVGVRRCRHYIPARPSGLKRLLHLLSFSASALGPACRVARRQRPDAVFTVAPSLLGVPVAWIAARLAGARLWIHVQDFEAEAAFSTGLLRPGPAARLALWLERRLLGLGHCVSAISPQMVARLADKGISAECTYELRNWASDGFAPDPAEAERYRAEWGIGERHVALYSGNIANKQGIDVVVEAARLLSGRKDLVFVMCGEGPNRQRLEEQCARLDNVQLHGLQPAARMGGLLAMASVHLLPQIASAADLVLPSKLCNMLLSGRPVVATAQPGTGLAAEVSGCGLVVEPGDARAFAETIETLLTNAPLAAQLGAAAAQRAQSHWQREAILRRFEARLLQLAGSA